MATFQTNNPFNQQQAIPGVKHIIAVSSGKGGVGKSTVSINLAKALTKHGTVGILDADIYGPSLPRMTGTIQQKPVVTPDQKIQPLERYNLKLMSIGYLVDENSAVVWRGPMLFKALDQFIRDVNWAPLDYLIIDLPPGTGDIHLSLAQKLPLSGAVVVSTPQNIAFADAKKAVDMWTRVGVKILGLAENMSYMRAPNNEKLQLFPKGELDAFLDSKKIPKLAEIPFNSSLALSAEAGIPILESSNSSEEALAFIKMAESLAQSLS